MPDRKKKQVRAGTAVALRPAGITVQVADALSTRTSRAIGWYLNRDTGVSGEVAAEIAVPSDKFVLLISGTIRRIQSDPNALGYTVEGCPDSRFRDSRFDFEVESVEELDAVIQSLSGARKEAENAGTFQQRA